MTETAIDTQVTPAATEVVQTPVTVEVVTPQVTLETVPVVSVEAIEAPVKAVEAPVTVLAEALDKSVETTKPPETKTESTTEASKEVVVTENKPTEGQSEEPAPPPTYEPFTVPEGFTLDGDRMSKFTELLTGLEVEGKVADHSFVQQFGQKAVDFHVQEVTRAVEDVTKLYQTAWEKQKTDWKDSFLNDPEIGGNRFQTTVDSARNFIRTYGGTTEQQKEFRDVMETSGLGNHPAIIRLLSKAFEGQSEGKPLAATRPVAPPKSKTATLYGGKS